MVSGSVVILSCMINVLDAISVIQANVINVKDMIQRYAEGVSEVNSSEHAQSATICV